MNHRSKIFFFSFFLSSVEGSAEPELCPAGTFSPLSGLTAVAGCLPCPAGFYCGEAGLTAPTGPCAQGRCMWIHMSNQRSVEHLDETARVFAPSNAVLCLATGYWCPPAQDVPTAFPCPPGHFCSRGSAAPDRCPPGFYQDREKQATCTVCEEGRRPFLPLPISS